MSSYPKVPTPSQAGRGAHHERYPWALIAASKRERSFVHMVDFFFEYRFPRSLQLQPSNYNRARERPYLTPPHSARDAALCSVQALGRISARFRGQRVEIMIEFASARVLLFLILLIIVPISISARCRARLCLRRSPVSSWILPASHLLNSASLSARFSSYFYLRTPQWPHAKR